MALHRKRFKADLSTSSHEHAIDPPRDAIAESALFDAPESGADSPGKRHGSSNRRTVPPWQWALASSGWITLLCVNYLPPGSLPRVLVVFGFVLVCPGLAVAGLIPTRESPERWVLAVALSVSFGLLVSVAFTVMRVESVIPQIVSLAVITTLAVLSNAIVAWRWPTSAAPAGEKADR